MRRRGLWHVVEQHRLPNKAVVALGKQAPHKWPAAPRLPSGTIRLASRASSGMKPASIQPRASTPNAQAHGVDRTISCLPMLRHRASSPKRQHEGGEHQRPAPASGSPKLHQPPEGRGIFCWVAQQHEQHGQASARRGTRQTGASAVLLDFSERRSRVCKRLAISQACRATAPVAPVNNQAQRLRKPGKLDAASTATTAHSKSTVPDVGRAAEQLAPRHLPRGERAQALLVPSALRHFAVDAGHNEQAAPAHGETGEQHRAGDKQVVARGCVRSWRLRAMRSASTPRA